MEDKIQLRENSLEEITESGVSAIFICHVIRIFCAKSHLLERLPELADQPNFKDLAVAIEDTINTTENQLEGLCTRFGFLKMPGIMDDCDALIASMESCFSMIHTWNQDRLARDLNILHYLQSVSATELCSLEILFIASNNFGSAHTKEFLKGIYDEAKKNTALQRLLISHNSIQETI